MEVTQMLKQTLNLQWFFLWSCMDVRVGLWRRLSAKEWCFWTVVLEKTLESPLDCKEIQAVHSEGDQPWVLFGRNDAEAETEILWPPHAKSWLIGKDSDAGKNWGQEEKGTTEDEMVGWHHWLDGNESEWTPGVDDGQGGLASCDSWGCRVGHDWATELNWTESNRCLFSVIWNVVFYLVGEFPPCHESETTIPRSYHHYPHWAGGKGKSVEKTRMC